MAAMGSNEENDEPLVPENIQSVTFAEEKQEGLSHFLEISGISSVEEASKILDDNNWDLERAVHSYMGFGDPNSSNQIRRRINESNIQVEVDSPNQHIVRFRPAPSTYFSYVFNIISIPVRYTFRILFDVFRLLLSFIWPDSNRSITDSAQDVHNFIEYFKLTYVNGASSENEDAIERDMMPPFFDGTYSQALQEAKKNIRFLVVYLHGDAHEDTDEFCKSTLMDSEVLNFLRNSEQLLFWACNLNSAEGYRVSQILHDHTYPFIGVIGLINSGGNSRGANRLALLCRIEGITPPGELVRHLSNIFYENEAVMSAARIDRVEREVTARLRQEQDEAYAVSLASDRAKAESKAAAEMAAAMAAQQVAQVKLSLQKLEDAQQRRKNHWRIHLPEMPPVGTPNTVKLSVLLPSGVRIERIFWLHDSVKQLYYFIVAQDNVPETFAVESNFPKRLIECKPSVESDIEDYQQSDGISDKSRDSWKPSDCDPPSFFDMGLTHPELLFVIDLTP